MQVHTPDAEDRLDLPTRIRRHHGALRVSELAGILSMSRGTIYSLVDGGRIPHLRIGDSVRFDPAVIAEWIEGKAA